MGNDDFVEILQHLKENKAQKDREYELFTENIDLMIEKFQDIIQLNGKIDPPPPSATPQNPNKKVKIEEILEVLRNTKKTTHIDKICQIIGDKAGSKVSRNMISMVISHYLRKFKSKAQIKKLQKFNYRIKK